MESINNTMGFNNGSTINNTGHPPFGPSPSAFLANGIFLAVISPLTVILNTLLLFAIYRDPFKTFQTPSAYFLVGLSMTDLVCGLLVEPFPMACYFMAYNGNPSTPKCIEMLQKHIFILASASINSSFLIVLAFTVVQYLAVSWPFKYKNIVTVRRTLICILAIWFYTILFQITEKFGAPKELLQEIDLILHTTISFIAMVTVYILLQRAFQKKIKKGLKLRAETSMQSTMYTEQSSPKAAASNKASQQSHDIEKRFIRINLFLIGLLFFCTIPNCVVWYIYFYNHEINQNPHFFVARMVADNAMWVKALVDPLIFAWRLPKYRKALRKSISRK